MKIHQLDLFKGTLSLLLLKSLTHGRRHGHELMRWIRKTSDETFLVEEGTIYPALHRLEARSYIESEWGIGAGLLRLIARSPRCSFDGRPFGVIIQPRHYAALRW